MLLLLPFVALSYFLILPDVDKYLFVQEESYVFIGIILVLLARQIQTFRNKNYIFEVNITDGIFLLFFIYSFLRLMLPGDLLFHQTEFLYFSSLFLVYFFVKSFISQLLTKDKIEKISLFFLMILICGFIEAGTGFLQYFDLLPNIYKTFKMAGTFGNPGPYGIFLSIMFSFSFGLFMLWRQADKKLRLFALICTILYMVIIALSNSRTAWIGTFISTLLILNLKYNLKEYFLSRLKTISIRIITISIVFIVFIGIAYFLYHYKQESANGRLLIWYISLLVIKSAPLFGVGNYNFRSHFNLEQGNFFQNNPDAGNLFFLADSGKFAFNDFLQIASQLGIIGLIILLVIFFLLIRHNNTENLSLSNLLKLFKIIIGVIGIMALFAYPLQTPVILFYFFLFAAIISGISDSKSFTFTLNGNIKKTYAYLIVSIFLFLMSYQLYQHYNCLQWSECAGYKIENDDDMQKVQNDYEKLLNRMDHNLLFMYNYASICELSKNNEKSVEIYNNLRKPIGSKDLMRNLGKCYMNMNEYAKAREAYLNAHYIIPYLLEPQYKIFLTYKFENNQEKTLEWARKISGTPIKVYNPQALEIKTEVNEYIKHYNEKI